MMYDLSGFGIVCILLSRMPLASPKIKCPNCPPSRPDSLANHQSLVPSPIPKCYLLINDSYMNKQLFNPTKRTPLEGSKAQLVNPLNGTRY